MLLVPRSTTLVTAPVRRSRWKRRLSWWRWRNTSDARRRVASWPTRSNTALRRLSNSTPYRAARRHSRRPAPRRARRRRASRPPSGRSRPAARTARHRPERASSRRTSSIAMTIRARRPGESLRAIDRAGNAAACRASGARARKTVSVEASVRYLGRPAPRCNALARNARRASFNVTEGTRRWTRFSIVLAIMGCRR
jgi:hypothetical protein